MSDFPTSGDRRSGLSRRIGDRVKAARARLDLTQGQVADRLGVPRSAISDIESGKRELSAAEVVHLAEMFGESLETFLSVAETEPSTEEPMFRAEAVPATARMGLERWMRRCDVYADLERDLGESPATELRPLTTEITSFQQVERLADEERARLDLGPTPAHVLLRVLEERLGIKVFYFDIDDSISGASVVNRRFGPAILVNGSHSPGRRVFTLAHELFHLLARGPIARSGRPSAWHVCDEGPVKQKRELVEQYADRFAGRLLMAPDHFIERLRALVKANGSIDPMDLIAIARYFGVSVQAVFVQLGMLGLAPRELTAKAYKDPQFQEDLRHAGESSGPVPHRFARLVVKACRAELISRGKVAELLEIDVGDVDTVLQQYGAGGSDHGIAVTLPR